MAFLAKYMKSHEVMASGYVSQSLQSKAQMEKQWEVLSRRLNSLGGPIKTVGKWKQAWRDMRNNEKKKAALKSLDNTDNGPPNTIKNSKSSPMSEADDDKMDDVATAEITLAGPSQAYMDFPGKKSPLFFLPEPLSPSHSPPDSLSNAHISSKPVRPVSRSALFRRRQRPVPKLEYLNSKLLTIEARKLQIKKEKNAALNRIADALVEMTVAINKKING